MSSGAPDYPTRTNLSNTCEDQPCAYQKRDVHDLRPQTLSEIVQDRIVRSDVSHVTSDHGMVTADGYCVEGAPGFEAMGAPKNPSLIDESGANTSDNTAAAHSLSQIGPAVHSQDLQIIPLEEIRKATNNFHKDNYLGGGGFGKVYKGELSRFEERGMVAFKRLVRQYGQGEKEFLKEISTLSQYKHENIITLLGYCREGKELILVYEYAVHGSLESKLGSRDLTWTQRLKICLQAAKGLRYLHDPESNGAHHKLIHCDIKSGNILLDDKWNAKVADVGLAKIIPENASLVTVVGGTTGYKDPQYYETLKVTDKLDVYSFGVTLFEVLCGRLCYETNGENKSLFFVHKWKKSCQKNKLDEIIFKELDMKLIDPSSIELFSDIAYKCLESRKKRPTMVKVVSTLEDALQAQECYDSILKHPDPLARKYIEIIRAAVSPVKYRSIEELKESLSEGVLVNGGKTWLSLNDKGENHVMKSIEDYLILDDPQRDTNWSKEKSRFAVGCYKTRLMEFKLRVKAPLFLSSDVTYGLNLVLHASEIDGMKQQNVGVRYKIQGETKISFMHFADKKEGKQLVAELYQFNSTEENILELEILVEDCGHSGDFYIEGIEFRPLEKVERQVVIANQEIVWGVVPPLLYRFTEESKVLLSQGVLLNGGKTMLSITEKGEHVERIYIQSCLNPDGIEARFLQHQSHKNVNSRFPGGKCYQYLYSFKARVRGQYLTPHISYTLNLVFRYEDQSDVNSYNPLRYKIDGEAKVFIIYPSYMREDGWFIVPLYHFTTQHTTADLQFEFEDPGYSLLVAGFEFQPCEEKVQLQVFEEYQHIVEAASQSLFYTSLDELKQILSIGVLLNGYKTWFSLNEKGEHCEMISMEDCLIPNEDSTPRYESDCWSSFPVGFYKTDNKGFKTHVKTQFLSPSVTYTVNLVYYSSSSGEQLYEDLKYRLKGEATTSAVYLASKRKDDYLHMAELYQFTSDGSIVDLEIIFENSGINIEGVEGILFQPLENVEDQVLEGDTVDDIQPISDSDPDTYWEQKLPNDYEEILKLSKHSVERKTKKELYSILCKGFLIDNDQQWFTVDNYGKKCRMLSARATLVIDDKNSAWESLPESRFGEELVITGSHKFEIKGEIKSEVLSPETNYASYLVYKLPEDQSTFEAPLGVWKERVYRYPDYPDWYIYLVSPPHTPIIGPKFDDNPLNRYKGTAIPQQRTDGWMEVKVWKFQTTTKSVPMYLYFEHPGEKNLCGLMIQGIELRPI